MHCGLGDISHLSLSALLTIKGWGYTLYPTHTLLQAYEGVLHWQVRPSEGEKPYSDLKVVRELRGMANNAKSAAKVLQWIGSPDLHLS